MAEEFKYSVNIDFSKAREEWAKFVNDMRRQSKELGNALAGISKQLESGQLPLDMQALSEPFKQVANELLNLSQQFQAFGNVMRQQTSAITTTSSAFDKFIYQLRSTFSLSELVKASLTTLGVGFGAFGLVQGIRQIAESVSEFDRHMREIWTLLDTTEAEFQAFSNEILKMSREIPLSTTELAKGIYWALSAGVPKENVLDLVSEASKAALAGVTSLKDTVDVITTVLNSYGYAANKVTEINDILFKGTALAKSTFEDLVTSIGPILPVAAQLGVSVEEVVAALGALSNMGISTARAATYINQALVRILSPTREASETARQLGIQFDSTAIKAMGFTQYLQYLKETVGNNEEALANLFENVRAMRAVFSLVSDQGMRIFVNMMNEIQNSAGATEEAFKKMNSALSYEWQRLKNIISSVFTVEGMREGFSDLLRTFNNVASGIVNVGSRVQEFKTILETSYTAIEQYRMTSTQLMSTYEQLNSIQQYLKRSTEDLQKLYANVESAFNKYNDAIATSYLAKHGFIQLTGDEEKIVKELSNLYPQLADAIDKVGDSYKINKDKLLDFMKAQVQNMELQLEYIKMNIENYKNESNYWKQQRSEYENQIKQVNETINVLTKLEDVYRKMGENVATTLQQKIDATMKEIGVKSIDQLFGREITTSIAGGITATGSTKMAQQYFEQAKKIEALQREVFETLIKGMIDGWANIANTVVADMPKDIKNSVNTLLNEMNQIFNKTAKMPAEQAWKSFRTDFDDFLQKNKLILEQLPEEVSQPLLLFYTSILKDYHNLQSVMEAIYAGYNPVRKNISEIQSRIDEAGYQRKQLESGMQQMDLKTKQAEIELETYSKIYDNLSNQIKSLSKKVQDIANKPAEVIEAEAVLDSAVRSSEKVLNNVSSLFEGISRATGTEIENIQKLGISTIKLTKGLTLEDLAKTYSDVASNLYNSVTEQLQQLELIDVSKLSGELKRIYEQQKAKLQSAKANLEIIVKALDIKELLQRYKISQDTLSTADMTALSTSLLKDFGINLSEVIESIAGGSKTIQATLEELKKKISDQINKTGIVTPETASDIANRVASSLLEFVNKQTTDYSSQISKSIQEATKSATFIEKIVSLADLLEKVQTGEDLAAILVPIYGKQFSDTISQEILPNMISQINNALQEALISAAQSGINVPALFKDNTANTYLTRVISQLKKSYDEQVQNFQLQVKQKYEQVFGKELANFEEAIKELLVRSETDKDVYLWIQRLNKLGQSIVDLGMNIRMLGGEVDVVKDLGGYTTSLLSITRDLSTNIGKFRNEIGNWKVAADLFASSELWKNLDTLERLRNQLDQLISEAIRPLRTNLVSIYYEIKQDEKEFSKYSDTLASIGVKTTNDLESTVIKTINLEGAAEQVRKSILDIASATATLGIKMSEAFENLPKDISAIDVLFGKRGDIQSFSSTISQIETQVKDLNNVQLQLIQARDDFKLIWQQLPEEMQTPLRVLLEIIDQFVSKYDEGLKNFEQSKNDLVNRYNALISDIFDYIQNNLKKTQEAIQSGDYLTLANILAELSKVDISAIPIKAEVKGQTGLQLRNQLNSMLDIIRTELNKFQQSAQEHVSNLRNRISVVDLLRQFIISGDSQQLLLEIDKLLQVPQLHLIKKLAEYADDPQIRESYSELAKDIEDKIISLRESIVKDVINFALTGIPSEDILLSPAHLMQLEQVVKQLIDSHRKMNLSVDDLERLLNQLSKARLDVLEEILEKEKTARQEIVNERLKSIESTAQYTFDKLKNATNLSVEELKQEYDKLYSYLLAEMDKISKEYPEFFENISQTFSKLFDKTSSEQVIRLKDVSSQWLESLTDQIEYMSTLAKNGVNSYNELLDVFIRLSEEIELFKTKVQSAGLFDEYRKQVKQMEEEIREIIKLDLSNAIGTYDIVNSLRTISHVIDVIVNKAALLTKYGVDLNELLGPVAKNLTSLFQTLPSFDFSQAFQETVFKPLAEAMANSLIQAWLEAAKEGEAATENLADVMQFAGKYLKDNIITATNYTAASLLMSSNKIISSLKELGIVGDDIANAITNGIEGAKIGWYIGQQISQVLTSASWITPTFTVIGGIFNSILGWIFQSIAEQQRKAQEIQQEIERLTDQLKSSFASAVTSAFDEVSLEQFRNNVRKSMLEALRDAFVQALTEKIITQQVAALASMFISPEGTLRLPSASEMEAARTMIEQVATAAEYWYQMIKQLFPELYSETTEWSASSAARTITEETANRLVGLFTTLTTYVYQIKRVIVDGETAVKVLVVNSASGTESLRGKGVI